jgi:hypothetical protein
MRVWSLQTARSSWRQGSAFHSYPGVAAELMTSLLRLGPLPSDHRGPRRRSPSITPGVGGLGPPSRPRACG